MADMSRDELKELRARAMCDCKLWPNAFDAECEGNQIEWRCMAEATMKAEADAGLAVVPRDATDEMKARVCAHNNRSTALRAAIKAGDLLGEK